MGQGECGVVWVRGEWKKRRVGSWSREDQLWVNQERAGRT